MTRQASCFCRACQMFAIVLLLAIGTAARSEQPAAKKANALRVLFLGNSQVYYNDLPRIVEALADSAEQDRPRIQAGRFVAGGASLQSLWEAGTGEGKPRALIAGEKWDFVVVQEIYTQPETFEKYAMLFDELIRQHGSRTVIYCTASINDLYPDGFQKMLDAQLPLAKKLKIPCAAAGRAWLQYWGDKPTLEARLALYHTDKAHPGVKGSYINACSLYALLTGKSPVGLTNRIPGQPADAITPDEAQRFQEAAWKVHQEVNGTGTARP